MSGGGFKGAFEAGAVYHLVVHRGCDFQDLSGVSAGALNVSFLAQAPSTPDSAARLAEQAERLVAFWSGITARDDILRPRLGWLGLVLGAESLNDFEPLWGKIKATINVDALRASKRDLRVGAVSMWDGRYREITPDDESLQYPEQFLEYVFASALVPVIGKMPRIRESETQPKDDGRWAQFGDGGIRHNTRVAGFFPAAGMKLVKKLPGQGEIPPHRDVAEIFIILASPYVAGSDQAPPPPCCPKDSDRHIRKGTEILERSLQLALDAPYRWDLNYAQLANKLLSWRDGIFEEIRGKYQALDFVEVVRRLDGEFPIRSFHHVPTKQSSQPYRLEIIAPPRVLGETFEFSAANIAMQLNEGCRAANRTMVSRLGMSTMEDRCSEKFPLQ